MAKQRSNLVLRILFFILTMVFVVGLLLAQTIKNATNDPSYVMNKATCTYNGEEIQELYGKWEFYWNEFLISNHLDESATEDYIDVPSKWNEYNSAYKGGFASYRAYVKGIPVGTSISIGFESLSCAYTAYINGEMVGKSGVIEKVDNASEKYTIVSIPGDQIEYSYYEVKDDNPIEIVIEVATNNNGGLYKCPILFTNDRISRFICNKIVQKCIIVGMFLIAVFMHLFRFLTVKKEERKVVPLLFSIALLLYSVFSGTLYAFLSITNIIKAANIIDYITASLDVMIALLICITVYDKNHKAKTVVGYIMAFISYALMLVMYAFESSGYYIPEHYKFAALTIKAVLMIFPMLFLFKPDDRSYVMLLTRFSLICLALSEFVKSVNAQGIFYSSTREFETLLTLLAIILSLVSYFLGINKTNKIIWENEKLTEDNTQYKINLLLNQIKPHFLYNTLNSINSLCKINPSEASNAIVSFSNYLRNNMDSISDSNMIPVSKELEHVKCYVDIEQIRFRERLKVTYDIKSYDFLVPPLAIQAIAENAIKHGMSSMVEGVTITIRTYDDKDYNYIIVADNGVGFDINSIVDTDSVGLRNIFKRIEMLCKGELILKSRVGKGTSITLKLKK